MTSHCPASSGNGDYLGRPPAASSPLVAKPLSSPPMWHPVNVPDIGGTTPDAAPSSPDSNGFPSSLNQTSNKEQQEDRDHTNTSAVSHPGNHIITSDVAQDSKTTSANDHVSQSLEYSVDNAPLARPRYGFRCEGGEILIMTGHGVQWQISEIDFRKASKQFAAILDNVQNKPIHLTKKDLQEGKSVCWKIQLVPNENSPSDMRLRTLKFFDGKKSKARVDMDNITYQGDENSPFNLNYDIFFRVICSKTRNMTDGIDAKSNDSKNDNKFISDVLGILIIAEEHEAIAAVASFLEVNLLRMGPRLWYYISTKPAMWLGIAARLESPIIFKEAMCHAVGRIDAKQFIDRRYFENKGKLYDNILRLLIQKVEALLALKRRVEWELTGWYPIRMYHPPDEGYVPDRGVYTSDIYLYQGRSVVMQYIAGCYAKGYHSSAQDGGIRFYQTIRHGGDAYCTKDQLQSFHARFAMSTKALAVFNGAVEIIKTEIKGCLDEIMVDNSEGKTNPDSKLGYLTCTITRDDELPWKLPLEDDILSEEN